MVRRPTQREQPKAWTTVGGARRGRLSESALRERILDTAVTMLTESGGLTASMAHLNMEELIRIAGVPRSSVYRAWGTKEAFHVDLMERMIVAPHSRSFLDDIFDADAVVLEKYADRLDTVEGRRSVLLEVIRQGVLHSFAGTARSMLWRTVTALAATLPALEKEDRKRIQAALAQSQSEIIDRFVEFYQRIFLVLGMRMKDGFDLHVFAATASSVMDGLMRRAVTNPEVVAHTVTKIGPDGEPVEWRLPEVAFLAIADAMIEPDPEYVPGKPA